MCFHCAELKAVLASRVMVAQYFLVSPYHLIPAIAFSVKLATAFIVSTVGRPSRKLFCYVDMPSVLRHLGAACCIYVMRSNSFPILSSKQVEWYDDRLLTGLSLFGRSISIFFYTDSEKYRLSNGY